MNYKIVMDICIQCIIVIKFGNIIGIPQPVLRTPYCISVGGILIKLGLVNIS